MKQFLTVVFFWCCLSGKASLLLVNGETCVGIGGKCGATTSCSDGLLVKKLCPGSGVCCVKASGLTKAEIHTNVVEGYMWLTGYVPTQRSGYDIGHGPDISACVGKTIWNKMKSFRNLKSRNEILKAGYDPSNIQLTVTFNEGRKIDGCVIALDKKIADKCSTKTSQCGSAVLISLAHWCGAGGLINGRQDKCSGSKAGEAYFKTFCANKGNDKVLSSTLEQLLAAHVRNGYDKTFRVNRVKAEIAFLKGCNN